MCRVTTVECVVCRMCRVKKTVVCVECVVSETTPVGTRCVYVCVWVGVCV